MITNDQELQATEERVEFFYRTVANIRLRARSPEEYRQYCNGYLAEIDRMHREIMAYFERHPSEAVRVTAEAGDQTSVTSNPSRFETPPNQEKIDPPNCER